MHSTDNFLVLGDKIAGAVHEAIKELVGSSDAGRILYTGADGTPTKLIDDAAEKAIFKVLSEEHSSFRIISEEAGEKIIGKSPDLTLIIDPIDGTYNASVNIPFYSLSLAITSADLNDIVFGYVQNLANGDTFYAEACKGAYFNGQELRPSDNTDVRKLCVSVYGYRNNMQAAANISTHVRRTRSLGSVALDLCYVAAGKIDAFADVRGTMRITDIAAGKLILEEAGGIVTNGNGESLKLEDQLLSRVCVIASNGLVHESILKLSAGVANESK
ncbi:bifunctional fructose-bisphosphatase/inositol-phosphate phosphatase [Methanolobus bombayensis]|uniref:bifunctional fructose-bisphosphatase/inositol-phosphate phosphatase n=1 Tax=Methanolobus bombayensis TaxID=38023 RepID=UPI001AE2EC27|nr:bifunctional fructose-bisphosphatase/inositol-phosphate phosphatase [Methanolobus bombayensis]MBP1909007.1 myo-inositol-1(or 4)-monophosphatase [Methanolobus bombayensis]